MATFYRNNINICPSDLTQGKRVQVKVSEFKRELITKIRESSNFDNKFFFDSFSPQTNSTQMANFKIGAGKSNSFFFHTENG